MLLSREEIAKLQPPEPVELDMDFTPLDTATSEIEGEYPGFRRMPKFGQQYDEYCSWAEKVERIFTANATGIITLSDEDLELVERGKASLLEDVDDHDIEVRLRELRPAYAGVLSAMYERLMHREPFGDRFDIPRVRATAPRLFDVIARTQVLQGAPLSGNEEWDLSYVRVSFRDLLISFFIDVCDASGTFKPKIFPELVFALPDNFVLVHHLLLDRHTTYPTETTNMFTGYPYGSTEPAFMISKGYAARNFVSGLFLEDPRFSGMLAGFPVFGEPKKKKGRWAPKQKDPQFWRSAEDSVQTTRNGDLFDAKLPNFEWLSTWKRFN